MPFIGKGVKKFLSDGLYDSLKNVIKDYGGGMY